VDSVRRQDEDSSFSQYLRNARQSFGKRSTKTQMIAAACSVTALALHSLGLALLMVLGGFGLVAALYPVWRLEMRRRRWWAERRQRRSKRSNRRSA
jgi:Flp pilus assembly protein TadB